LGCKGTTLFLYAKHLIGLFNMPDEIEKA